LPVSRGKTRSEQANSEALEPRTLWQRIKVPVEVTGGIVGVVVALATLGVTLFGNPFSGDAPPTNPDEFRAFKIDKCMREHGLGEPHVRTQVGETLTFSRCDWPSPAPEAADGFTKIVIESKSLGTPAAERFTDVDRITAPCDNVKITFVFSQMGGHDVSTNTVQRGEILDVNEGKPLRFIPLEYDVPDPGIDEIVAFRNLRYTPRDAWCAVEDTGG
jgi:hypothetical protein